MTDNLNEAFSEKLSQLTCDECGLTNWSCNTLQDIVYEKDVKIRHKLAIELRKDMTDSKAAWESLIKQARRGMIRQLQIQVSINNTPEQNEDKILALINHWDTELEGDK